MIYKLSYIKCVTKNTFEIANLAKRMGWQAISSQDVPSLSEQATQIAENRFGLFKNSDSQLAKNNQAYAIMSWIRKLK